MVQKTLQYYLKLSSDMFLSIDKRRDIVISVGLFFFFFLITASFQMLKPIKSGLFIQNYGAHLELYAKMANIFVAAWGVLVFTFLFKKLPRQQILYVFSFFFMSCFIALAFFLSKPNPLITWGFYLLGDLQVSIMVAAFWAYLTDIYNTHQAKRLFGMIGGGGVIGGWIGITLTKILLDPIGSEGLLLLAAGMMGGIWVIVIFTERLIIRSKGMGKSGIGLMEAKNGKDEKTFGLLEGVRLALKSKYLIAIAGMVLSYEFASQIMDYQFKLVAESLSGVKETQAFMTNVYFFANVLSVFVQLFLVSLCMRKLGLVVTLLILPLALIGGSLGFLIAPSLLAVSLLVIFDNGLNYSLQQTARESLFIVTNPEEKYIARAFITIFVQRLAKGVSILFVIGLGLLSVNPYFLGLFSILAMVVMAFSGRYAGRYFAQRSGEARSIPATKAIFEPNRKPFAPAISPSW